VWLRRSLTGERDALSEKLKRQETDRQTQITEIGGQSPGSPQWPLAQTHSQCAVALPFATLLSDNSHFLTTCRATKLRTIVVRGQGSRDALKNLALYVELLGNRQLVP